MELSKGTKTSSVFIGGGFTFGVFCLKLLSQFLSPVLIARMPLLTFAVLDLYEILKRATFRKIIWLLSALLKKNIVGFSKSQLLNFVFNFLGLTL